MTKCDQPRERFTVHTLAYLAGARSVTKSGMILHTCCRCRLVITRRSDRSSTRSGGNRPLVSARRRRRDVESFCGSSGCRDRFILLRWWSGPGTVGRAGGEHALAFAFAAATKVSLAATAASVPIARQAGPTPEGQEPRPGRKPRPRSARRGRRPAAGRPRKARRGRSRRRPELPSAPQGRQQWTTRWPWTRRGIRRRIRRGARGAAGSGRRGMGPIRRPRGRGVARQSCGLR